VREQPNPHLNRPKPETLRFSSGLIDDRDGRQLILPPYPNIPSPFDKADVGAWKGLNLGTAAPHQQMRAIDHLAILCDFNGNPYVPGDQYATAFALGKRFVFVQINNMIRLVLDPAGRSDGGEQG
jgi:hypothetical protein